MRKTFTILLSILALFAVQNIQAQCIWTIYNTSNGLLNNNLKAIDIGPNGNVVIATDYDTSRLGFSIYDGIQWKTYEDDSLISEAQIKDIVIDEDGMVWYGGGATGLHAVKGNYKQIYHASDGLSGEDVESLYIDDDGYLWIGNWGGGVTKMIDSAYFEQYNTSNSDICDDYIVDMDKDHLGRMYYAGYNGCVSVYDGTNFTTISTDLYELTQIAVDNMNNIWAAGYDASFKPAVYKYDSVGTLIDTILDFSFISATGLIIYDIASDYDDNFYLATSAGLAVQKSSSQSWTVYKSADGLPANNIKSAAIDDRTGMVWITTDGGAAKLESKGVVTGNIDYDGSPATIGYIKVFKYMEEGVKKLEMYDSVGINMDGTFMIDRMTIGSYTLFVVLDEVTYTDAIPTYYGDVEVWSSAASFKVLDCDTSSLSTIYVIKKINLPKGNGRINGYIKSLDGTRAVSNPIKDVDVTLKKVPGGVVQKAKTNSSGFYEFNELPNGSYSTLVDLPGLEQDSTRTIEITNDDTTYNHQDYGIDSNGIHVGDYTSIIEVAQLKGVTVYPNPAVHQLNVRVEADHQRSMRIEILDLLGRNYYTNNFVINGFSVININIESMAQGIYILKISEDDKIQNTKIQIK